MIFVDSNIPMYLVGAPHTLKVSARQLLETAIASGDRLVTSAEVCQEILMERREIRRIMTFDAGFDGVPGLRRMGS